MRKKPSRHEKILAPLILALLLLFTGCEGPRETTITRDNLQDTSGESGQFSIVSKDGIEIACPNDWQTETDRNLVYCASCGGTRRITVAVLDSLPTNYYEGLVAQGTVIRTVIAGYLSYRNDYTYQLEGTDLISQCITLLDGNKACHVMFLCDMSALETYKSVFDYILNSIKFTGTG